MNYPASTALQRPHLERWVHDLARTVTGAWRAFCARRDEERSIDAMADLSAAVLRDIGAPDDLLGRAAARRQAEARCLEDLRILANYRGVDSRFW